MGELVKINKKLKRPKKYLASKERLLKLFIQREPLRVIAGEFSINMNTAKQWRDWLVEDDGDIVDKKIHKIKTKFIASTLAETEYIKGTILKSIEENKEDPKALKGLSDSFSGIQRTQMEAMTRFNIIAPEQVDHNVHFAGQGIEVIFLDENKQKTINVDAKVRNKEDEEE